MAILAGSPPPSSKPKIRPAKVSTFPMARLKFAARLRVIADGLAKRGDADGGDVFILHVDPDGRIITENLMGNTRDRALRMIGLLETAKSQLVMMMSCSCEED